MPPAGAPLDGTGCDVRHRSAVLTIAILTWHFSAAALTLERSQVLAYLSRRTWRRRMS